MIQSILYKIKKNPYSFFIFKIILLAAIVFILDFSIGKTLQYFYFKQSSGYLYRTTYSIEKTNAEILIFGTSRAAHHYNSTLIENQLHKTCYNAGGDGQSTFYHYAIFKAALSRYSPKIIIFDLNITEFVKGNDSYDRLSALLPYYQSHREIQPIVNLKSNYEKYKLVSQIYPYNSLLLKIIMGNLEINKNRTQLESDIKGYVPLYRTWNKPICNDKSTSYEIDYQKVKYFENLIKDCKKNKIQLYIVVSPFFIKSNYADYSVSIGQNIAKKYAIPFYNYYQDSVFITNHSLFADMDHLNSYGAEIFSKLVVDKIKYQN